MVSGKGGTVIGDLCGIRGVGDGGIVRGSGGGAVFRRLGLTTDVRNFLARQGSDNVRCLELLRIGKSLGSVYRNQVFRPLRSLRELWAGSMQCVV